MSFLGFLFFAWLGQILYQTHGHYDPIVLWMTIAFLLLVFEMARRRPWMVIGERGTERLLSLCAVFFCALQFRRTGMIYAEGGSSSAAMEPLMGIATLLSLVVFGISWIPKRSDVIFKVALALGVLGIAALVMAEILVPTASPKPWIDVWYVSTAAVDYFTTGLNPYAQKYLDIYHGKYGPVAYFPYLPGLLFWITPFRVVLGDIRYGLIFANWISAGAFYFWARPGRGKSLIPLLAALLWLSFPVTLFVIEQSWVDLALIPGAILMFLAMRAGRNRLTAAAMGIFLSIKQYAFVTVTFALLWIWRKLGFKRALWTGLIALGVFMALLAPFVIADAHEFYRMTVLTETDQGIRLDALNFTAFLVNGYGRVISGNGRILLALLGAMNGALILLRGSGRDTSNSSGMAAASFAAYGFAFIFGKWAFCNYYFFLASFLLIFLVSPTKTDGSSPA